MSSGGSGYPSAAWRHEDVLLVGAPAADELLDDLRGVELPGDGDEAVVVLAEALALQTQALGDPEEENSLVNSRKRLRASHILFRFVNPAQQPLLQTPTTGTELNKE